MDLEFPYALPGIRGFSALGVVPNNLEECLLTSPSSGVWEHAEKSIAAISDAKVRKLIEVLGCEFPLCGQMSQCCSLTLDANAKRSANIPANADAFCWGNPIFLSRANKENIKELDATLLESPKVSFLLYGGFIYFEGEMIVQCNSLVPSNEGLFFSPPTRLEFVCLHYHIRDSLAHAGRFQEVTIENFKERGAKFFSWILPGEFNLCANGGFMYLFGENFYSYHEQDCLFAVLGQNEYKRARKRLKTESSTHKFAEPAMKTFILAGMTSEQTLQLQNHARERQKELDVLLDQREKKEHLLISEWTTNECVAALTRAGTSQHAVKLIKERNLNGSDLLLLTETVNFFRKSDDDNKNAGIQKLQQELESLKICLVCLEAERCAMFDGCRHVPTCMECSKRVEYVCPLCRLPNQSAQQVFFKLIPCQTDNPKPTRMCMIC